MSALAVTAHATIDARGRAAWLAALADLLEAEPDVVRALRALEAAGAIKAGWKPGDYFTNDLVG